MRDTFPFNCGSGGGTTGSIHCDWCGSDYNEGFDEGGGDDFLVFHFGDLQILDCCFDNLEEACYQHIPDMVSWYRETLRKKRNRINEKLMALEEK